MQRILITIEQADLGVKPELRIQNLETMMTYQMILFSFSEVAGLIDLLRNGFDVRIFYGALTPWQINIIHNDLAQRGIVDN